MLVDDWEYGILGFCSGVSSVNFLGFKQYVSEAGGKGTERFLKGWGGVRCGDVSEMLRDEC